MTVTTNTNKVQAIGNGSAKAFPYSFRVYSATDLIVTRTDIEAGVDARLVLNTDYTVTGAGSYNGGNVIFATAPTDDMRITIQRVVPITQGADLRNQGAYFAETHEDVFDKLVMIDQQHQEELNRSFTFPASDDVAAHGDLPPAGARADKLLGFDSAGRPVAVAPAAQSAAALQTLLVSAAGATLVGFSQPLTAPKLVTQHSVNKHRLYANQITGIDPDGPNCSAPLQVLVNEMLASGYQELVFGSGTYTFQNVNVPSKIQIIAQGRNTKFLKPVGSGTGSHLLRFNGSVGAASALTANAVTGGMTAAVANGALFAANSYVIVRANVYISGAAGRRQEIKRVLSVAGNVLTFSTPLFEDYTTALSSEVCILNPVIGAALHNVSLEGQNANLKGGLIKALYGIDLMFDEVHGQYMSDQAAFSLGTCLNSTIQFCSAKDGINMTAGGYGYGAEFDEATTFSKIVDSYFENVRESTFTNRTRYSKFARNTCVGNYDSGFNTHGAYVAYCEVEDNSILSPAGAGIAVGYGSHGAGDLGITIKRNRIRNAGGSAITISAPAGLGNDRIQVADNHCYGYGRVSTSSIGLLVQNSARIQSSDNYFEGVNTNASDGLYIVNTNEFDSVGDQVRNIPNGYGITFDTCSNSTVADATVSNVSSYNVRSLGTNSNVRVHLKYRDHNQMLLGAGVSYTGRRLSGTGTMTFAGESSKAATITFATPFPTGVIPAVTVSVDNNLGAFRANTASVGAAGFQINITDIAGAARTGTVNYAWSADER